MKKKTSAARLAAELDIPKSRAVEAGIKAKLIVAILAETRRRQLTHAYLAERSGLARTTVTGMLSGSLQRVSLGRILRLLEAAGLEADVKIRRAA